MGKFIFVSLKQCKMGYHAVLGQNGWHFTDDIFLMKTFWISYKISLRYVPLGLIDKKSTLVQVMAWHLLGTKPLPEPMLGKMSECHAASLGHNELTLKHRETHGCVVSTVATDALVLKHQAISIHNAD